MMDGVGEDDGVIDGVLEIELVLEGRMGSGQPLSAVTSEAARIRR